MRAPSHAAVRTGFPVPPCHLAVAALPAGAPVEFGEPSTVEISTTGFKVNQVVLTGNVSLVGGATYDP